AQRRPDGSSAVADALPFPEQTGDLEAAALEAWAYLEEHHFPAWVADSLYALERVSALAGDSDSDFFGRVDLGRIGAFGWSFGGATAIQLLVSDPRIGAAIDMDGQLFGDAHEHGCPRPCLLLSSSERESPAAASEEEAERNRLAIESLMARVEARQAALLAASTGAALSLEIAGTTHAAFSDFALLAPGAAGPIGGERADEILTALVLEYFSAHLLGRPSELLADPTAAYPEIRPVAYATARAGS
ncbi:MAG: hypothetical protein R3190_15940, partial [Thermoanaerobaculia bacterium]|nr:hypothetical protein [Thermoanaerobaculia bacterium]